MRKLQRHGAKKGTAARRGKPPHPQCQYAHQPRKPHDCHGHGSEARCTGRSNNRKNQLPQKSVWNLRPTTTNNGAHYRRYPNDQMFGHSVIDAREHHRPHLHNKDRTRVSKTFLRVHNASAQRRKARWCKQQPRTRNDIDARPDSTASTITKRKQQAHNHQPHAGNVNGEIRSLEGIIARPGAADIKHYNPRRNRQGATDGAHNIIRKQGPRQPTTEDTPNWAPPTRPPPQPKEPDTSRGVPWYETRSTKRVPPQQDDCREFPNTTPPPKREAQSAFNAPPQLPHYLTNSIPPPRVRAHHPTTRTSRADEGANSGSQDTWLANDSLPARSPTRHGRSRREPRQTSQPTREDHKRGHRARGGSTTACSPTISDTRTIHPTGHRNITGTSNLIEITDLHRRDADRTFLRWELGHHALDPKPSTLQWANRHRRLHPGRQSPRRIRCRGAWNPSSAPNTSRNHPPAAAGLHKHSREHHPSIQHGTDQHSATTTTSSCAPQHSSNSSTKAATAKDTILPTRRRHKYSGTTSIPQPTPPAASSRRRTTAASTPTAACAGLRRSDHGYQSVGRLGRTSATSKGEEAKVRSGQIWKRRPATWTGAPVTCMRPATSWRLPACGANPIVHVCMETRMSLIQKKQHGLVHGNQQVSQSVIFRPIGSRKRSKHLKLHASQAHVYVSANIHTVVVAIGSNEHATGARMAHRKRLWCSAAYLRPSHPRHTAKKRLDGDGTRAEKVHRDAAVGEAHAKRRRDWRPTTTRIGEASHPGPTPEQHTHNIVIKSTDINPDRYNKIAGFSAKARRAKFEAEVDTLTRQPPNATGTIKWAVTNDNNPPPHDYVKGPTPK